jgi:hypothetical protein
VAQTSSAAEAADRTRRHRLAHNSQAGAEAEVQRRRPRHSPQSGGKLIALQIKTGASYFRKLGDDYVFYGEDRHREYWTNHSLPVFLILHNPESGLTLWQRIERHLIEEGAGGRWAIVIPPHQTLDEDQEHFIAAGIASDISSLRRVRLAIDLPLIRRLQDVSKFESARGIKSIIEIAKALLVHESDEFDSCKNLLGCKNGVLHLPTLELRQNTDEIVTRRIGTVYDPMAMCAEFSAFLQSIFKSE